MDGQEFKGPPAKSLALIGVGLLGLGSFRIMAPRHMGRPISSSWTPEHIAVRAFGLGSLLCVSTATTVVGLLSCWLNCSTLMEFGEVMRQYAPEQRRRIQRFIGIQDIDNSQRYEPSSEELAALAQLDRIFSDALNEKSESHHSSDAPKTTKRKDDTSSK